MYSQRLTVVAVAPEINWNIPADGGSNESAPLTVNWDIEVKEEQGIDPSNPLYLKFLAAPVISWDIEGSDSSRTFSFTKIISFLLPF